MLQLLHGLWAGSSHALGLSSLPRVAQSENTPRLETYQHTKLPSPASIRLIKLIAGEESDRLQGEIHVADQHTSPKYAALSYVWGSEENPHGIGIATRDGERSLQITANLASALKRLRSSHQDQFLWIDSISINQLDDAEKSQQVPLMGEIYRRAAVVRIWLGEVLEAADAYRCLQRLLELAPAFASSNTSDLDSLLAFECRLTESGLTHPSSDMLHDALSIPRLSSVQFRALYRLLRNPWFTRAWTWQESFAAKARTFHWGQYTCSDSDLTAVYVVPYRLGHISQDPKYCLQELHAVAFMLNNENHPLRDSPEVAQYSSFLSVLQHRSGSGCKYPSDLIYSLLGAAKRCPSITVNYKEPFEKLFAHTAYQVMRQECSLLLLSDISPEQSSPVVPTWTPNWRDKAHWIDGIARSMNEFYEFAATGSSKPILRLSNDKKVLSSHGISSDRISKVVRLRPNDVWESIASLFNAPDLQQIYRPTNETLDRAIRRVLLLDSTIYRREKPFTRWKPGCHDEYEEIVKNSQSTDPESRSKYASLVEAVVESSYQGERVVVVTEHGRIGRTSKNALPGDEIVLLFGGKVPYVLRPLQRQASHYTFVADCYLHGFMDGEGLFDAWRAAHPQWDMTDSSWLWDLDLGQLPFLTEEFYLH